MGNEILNQFLLVVVLGIGAQWIAWRMRMPAIAFLALMGVVAGPVFHVLEPHQHFGDFTTVIVKLAVAVILFEGGLNLRLFELKQAGRVVRRLVFVGIPITAVLGTLSAHWVAGLSLPVSMVLGAILVVTGPTVIMPLVRQTKLSPRVASLFKWEGIINDPLGALLAVLVFEYFIASGEGSPTAEIFLGLGKAFVSGISLGIGGGYFLKAAFKRGWVPEFLKVPVILSMTLSLYGAANFFQEEAGLLAVTIFGFVVGNVGLKIIYELRRFKEYITVFLVSSVFVILTADLQPSQLAILNWQSLPFFFCILFLVRPISVFVATLGTDMSWKEKLLLGWIAPRGVVAASMAGLFAPRMLVSGYNDASFLIPLVFSVVFITVIAHGFSFRFLAQRLGLASSKSEGIMIIGASPWSTELAGILKEMGVQILLVDSDWHKLREARLKGVPVYHGEALSETSEEALDLSHMGYLLAASDNDAYNALVCSEFAPEFGRDRVFQLAMHDRTQKESNSLRSANRGRTAFGKDLPYEKLVAQYYGGWRFQKTMITEEFSFEDFTQMNGNDSEALLLMRKSGSIVFDTSNNRIKPEAGDCLLSYIAPQRGAER